MRATVRTQLSAMMFLEYFIWGSWFVTMGAYLTTLKFQGTDIGNAYSTTAWASIIASFFIGMVADKYFAAERLTGVLHVVGGCLLFAASRITTPGPFFWVLLLYTIFYMPTIALTNAIAFHQTTDAGKDFPNIRVFGTIGWIAAGLLVGLMKIELGPLPMQIGAVTSIIMGLFCFSLPNTPPQSTGKKTTVRDILGLDALKLMKDPSYAVLIISSLLITIPFATYHEFTNMYMNETGVQNAAAKMTLGQASEFIFMLLMPWFFTRLGVKKMLATGMLCWVIRYASLGFSNAGSLVSLIYLGIILHGMSYDFFFVTGQIYVDKRAPAALKASVQGFLALVTYGVGWLLGSQAAGWILQTYQKVDTAGNVVGHQWRSIMMVPAYVALAVLVIFWVLFKDEKKQPAAAAAG